MKLKILLIILVVATMSCSKIDLDPNPVTTILKLMHQKS